MRNNFLVLAHYCNTWLNYSEIDVHGGKLVHFGYIWHVIRGKWAGLVCMQLKLIHHLLVLLLLNKSDTHTIIHHSEIGNLSWINVCVFYIYLMYKIYLKTFWLHCSTNKQTNQSQQFDCSNSFTCSENHSYVIGIRFYKQTNKQINVKCSNVSLYWLHISISVIFQKRTHTHPHPYTHTPTCQTGFLYISHRHFQNTLQCNKRLTLYSVSSQIQQ